MIQYITPEQFDIAKNNGISEELLKYRVFDALWDVKRAITKPPRKHNRLPKHILENLKKHNINRSTFNHRIYTLNWNMERASTEQAMTPQESGKASTLNRRRFTDEIIQRAATYGVGYKTLVTRVCNYKWDMERAITTPVMKPKGNEKWKDFVIDPHKNIK